MGTLSQPAPQRIRRVLVVVLYPPQPIARAQAPPSLNCLFRRYEFPSTYVGEKEICHSERKVVSRKGGGGSRSRGRLRESRFGREGGSSFAIYILSFETS